MERAALLLPATSRAARRMASVGFKAMSSAAAGAAGPAAPANTAQSAAATPPVVATTLPCHTKHKDRFKRASAVMSTVTKEAWLRMQDKLDVYRPKFPEFNMGDAIEIEYVNETKEVNPHPIRGTVIAKRNKGVDTKFSIINSMGRGEDQEWYTATYTVASPLLRRIRVMMRNRHTDGEKRARRAKLTYLFNKDEERYLVDQYTKEPEVVLAEKEAIRAFRRLDQKRDSKKEALRKENVAKAKAAAKGTPVAGAKASAAKPAAAAPAKPAAAGKK